MEAGLKQKESDSDTTQSVRCLHVKRKKDDNVEGRGGWVAQ